MIEQEKKEKRFVTISSVIAAIFLTAMKLIVGVITGSIGILSEALHSGLDLVAALITFFAVEFADKPPDFEHHYGHGKIENLSALIETLLLLLTCVWILYEAIGRLVSGNTHIEVTIWSYIVIIVSIIIDVTRSRALNKVAKKYNSQAIEADALHFSTDILSSSVVLIGLIGAAFDYHFADSFAAILVSLIVVYISIKLGKRAIDALLDKTPNISVDLIRVYAMEIPNVVDVHDIKIRSAGPIYFIEMNIHVDNNLSIEKAHEISHLVSQHIQSKINKSEVHIHIEPSEMRE